MITGVALIEQLLEDAHHRDSYHHGEAHWRGVAQAGHALAAADHRVDADVVLLFAVLHDSRRENEFADPGHGPRAAARAEQRVADLLAAGQADALIEALRIHNGSGPVEDPTIGACLDADRLNLWRVGYEPDPALLSTAYARRPEVIAWGRALSASYCADAGFMRAGGVPVGLWPWEQLVAAHERLRLDRAGVA